MDLVMLVLGEDGRIRSKGGGSARQLCALERELWFPCKDVNQKEETEPSVKGNVP